MTTVRLRPGQLVLPIGVHGQAIRLPPAPDTPEKLKADILAHLQALGLPGDDTVGAPGALTKENIRRMHDPQRAAILIEARRRLAKKIPVLLRHFADGCEVDPERIDPEIVRVRSDTLEADLFRFATLLWSVPVSRGFGRRMRFLVRDRHNGKLIGVFGLTDPVFNLRVRDQWVGWDQAARRERLVHVMDAHVVGAVPPYAQLLGGKLVTSLIASAEVNREFERQYGKTEGIISGEKKHAKLALVTITSALGRSSIYNRLHLQTNRDKHGDRRTLVRLEHVGSTTGYGHFQLSDDLFARLRALLANEGHRYADGHQYGDGPNWRMRLAREGLKRLGLNEDRLLRHGIARDVYVMPLADNCRDFLKGDKKRLRRDLATVEEIVGAAKQRWVLPRSAWTSAWRELTFSEMAPLLAAYLQRNSPTEAGA